MIVNNWANGWILNSSESLAVSGEQATTHNPQAITIFYWPQVLEWAGFGMLVGVIGWLCIKKK